MIFHPRSWLEPHLLDALDSLRFELRSIKGRLLGSRLPLHGREYLQIGCYECLPGGFFNTDFFGNPKADAHLDARFPLPFDDSVLKGIYAHHVVEHLEVPDALKLFRECQRVLKPGGVLRMIVPDAEVFLRLYMEKDPERRSAIFHLFPESHMAALDVKTPIEMINHVFHDQRSNRHHFAWDWETARLRLLEAGYSNVHRSQVNESLDPLLAGHDKAHWAAFSLYVEAVK